MDYLHQFFQHLHGFLPFIPLNIATNSNIVAGDFVSTSSGAADSGKVHKLDSNGNIPVSFLLSHVDTSTVFASATSPNATFTDLDLSAVIGAKTRMVLLKVKYTQINAGCIFSFKRKGDADTFPTSTTGGGIASVLLTNLNDCGYVMVPTNSAGVVQWTGNGTGQKAQITLEAYW